MHKLAKQSMLLFVALSLVMIPFSSSALAEGKLEYKEPGAGAMTYDLILLRPFGAAATLAGSVVFVFSLPFSALGGNVPSAGKKLVSDPFHHTFTRPLGTWNRRE